MKVIVASDHVGLSLKQAVMDYLTAAGVSVTDAGPYDAMPSVDYPDYAQIVGQEITRGAYTQGILICGTGLGMSIAANKIPGIRAALCHDPYTAHQGRAHNDANVLCMGAWIVSPQRVNGILDEWFKTDFEHGRHVARLLKLESARARPDKLSLAARTTPLPSTQIGISLSPLETVFGPLLYAGHIKDGVRAAARAGFTCVELSLRNPETIDVTALCNLLQESQLTVSAIATGQNCLHDGLCFATHNEETRRATIARVNALIEVAASFGAATILGGIRGRFSNDPAVQVAERQAAVLAMRECAEYALQKNVTLLIEPINRYETNFINTAEEGIVLIQEIGVPSVKLLLDSFHMNLEQVSFGSAIRSAGAHLAYFHFADSNRCAPGMGHLDWAEVTDALAAIQYRGPLVAEILPLPDNDSALRQAGSFFQTFAGSRLISSSNKDEMQATLLP